MPDVVLHGLPDHLHRALKSAARQNRRSLRAEILARLTASFRGGPVTAEALLKRIRLRRESIGLLDLSEGNLREMWDAGRP